MRPPMKPLKPLDEALAELLGHATPLTGVDTVTTFDADGRVLAQDCISALHVPPQDNSSMDGYAVRCADVAAAGALLPVSQRIAAGSAGEPLQPALVGACEAVGEQMSDEFLAAMAAFLADLGERGVLLGAR